MTTVQLLQRIERVKATKGVNTAVPVSAAIRGKLDLLAQRIANTNPGDPQTPQNVVRAAIAEISQGEDPHRVMRRYLARWPISPQEIEV